MYWLKLDFLKTVETKVIILTRYEAGVGGGGGGGSICYENNTSKSCLFARTIITFIKLVYTGRFQDMVLKYTAI